MSKNTSSEQINRFSLLTSEGKKKNKEELKKKENKTDNKTKKQNNVQKHTDSRIVKKTNIEQQQNIEKKNDIQQDEKNDMFDIFEKKIENLEKCVLKENNILNRDDASGKNHYLNSQWTVWVHRNECKDWTVSSYQNIALIDSISSFWSFFNFFHKINKEDNQYFIMRNKIKPIWEDNNNRNGGICSLKMDCYDRNSKIDVGSEFMISLCLLIMNETLIPDNSEINGIAYSLLNRSIMIKIWYKEHTYNIKDKLPKNLLDEFISTIKNRVYKKINSNISIRCTQIRPEYDDTN